MKTYLQCGYEDECKNKDCLNCKRQYKKYNINLSLAESCVIEDFAVCDLQAMEKIHPKELALMQKISFKIMKKIFAIENKGVNVAKSENNSQQPRIKPNSGGELKPIGVGSETDNSSPADTILAKNEPTEDSE